MKWIRFVRLRGVVTELSMVQRLVEECGFSAEVAQHADTPATVESTHRGQGRADRVGVFLSVTADK